MNIEKLCHSARGSKWHSRTIEYMLENSFYKGIAHYKDNIIRLKI
jgi:hypothetical protein